MNVAMSPKVNLIWKLTDMSRRELARTMAMERPENMKSEKLKNNSNEKNLGKENHGNILNRRKEVKQGERKGKSGQIDIF